MFIKRISISIILSALYLMPFYCQANENPIVDTPLGKIKGTRKKSYNHRVFSAFEGIPFAKPPVGALRFKEPKAVEKWDGIWDATTPHACLQFGRPNYQPQGEEDCLYINVYVPRENPSNSDKLDVIVHIHGGAFMTGSGHFFNRPTFLMDRDVVFVSFNYRLGTFGFLSTEDEIVPGNNGLKDQSLALKWIRHNINRFGGNRDSITITGVSAGGASVHFHYFSPLSKGLFHRGIAHSGTALNPWALQEGALEKAKKLASFLGCNQVSTEDFINCLRQRPAKAIVEKTTLFYDYLFLPLAPFAPVVEKTTKKAFLSEHPYELLKTGNINDVPLITSITTEEGIFTVTHLKDNLKEINEKWTKLIPCFLDINYTAGESEKSMIADKVKKFYFNDKPITEENIQSFIKLFTDRHFAHAAEITARLQSKKAKSAVYFFVFGYRGERSLGRLSTVKSTNDGVCHGDDTLYLYDVLNITKLSNLDEQMKEIFLDMYTTFAKTNQPQMPSVKWSPVSNEFKFLRIEAPDQIRLEKAEELTPRQFWQSLPIKENEKLFTTKDEL